MEITSRINVPKIFLRRLVTWVMREVRKRQAWNWEGRVTFITSQETHSRSPRGYDAPIVVHVARGGYEFERWFQVVCLMYATLARPNDVPDGELGPYRTEVSRLFTEQGRDLIEKWQNLVSEKDPNKNRKRKVQNAKKMVGTWQRKTKLAATKLKVWNRRLVAAQRALEKAAETKR